MTKPKPNWLITVASWEDRFRLGTERLIEQHQLSTATVFYYMEYDDWTKPNREAIARLFKQRGISAKEIPISFAKPVEAWHALRDEILLPGHASRIPVVDFTTMPRDTLWSALSLLSQLGVEVNYAYHRPDSYAEWLSRDPGRPRLVYKLSGIAALGKPTCLIIATGFDPERTRQMMWHYEPRQVLLGFQIGAQFANDEKNIARHQKSLKEEYAEFAVKEFHLDAYSDDRGRSVLAGVVDEWTKECNVVMTSLGPKLGAIAMYEVHRDFPESALTYTPSGEFNREYSNGIGESYAGLVDE
jgi:hypothetical protein